MRIGLAGLLFMWSMAVGASGPSNLVEVEVANSGPVVVGGSNSVMVVNGNGNLYIPVKVDTQCQSTPHQDAMIYLDFSESPQGQAKVAIELHTSEQGTKTPCVQAWMTEKSQYTLRIDLVQGTSNIRVGGGPLKGLDLLISSQRGATIKS